MYLEAKREKSRSSSSSAAAPAQILTSPSPNHALPATTATAAAAATVAVKTAAAPPRWSFSRALEYFIAPLIEHNLVNGCVPLNKLPVVRNADKTEIGQAAKTHSLERAHRARFLMNELEKELTNLKRLNLTRGRRRARFRKGKQEIMKTIHQICLDMATPKVFRPISNHERLNPSIYVTPKMLGHDEPVVLDIQVLDLYGTEEERQAHKALVCELFPELNDMSFLSVDVGTVIPVAGFDLLNGRLFKVGESISHRLIKRFDRQVAGHRSTKSKKEQQLHGKLDPCEAEKLTQEIDEIDEEIHDLYQRRRNVASRVHGSILDVIQLYDCVLMPQLKAWRGWKSSARAQASAIRLQEWQSKVKNLCEQRNILLINEYPEHWTSSMCLHCQSVDSPQGRRVYVCSNKSCVKHIERLVTLRDPESSIKIGLSFMWRLLQSRKQNVAMSSSAASAARGE